MKFEKTEVWGFEHAIRGMRNPMNSWDKGDSGYIDRRFNDQFYIGKNDLDLAQRLIKAGSEHRKFMRQIFVSVDITAPQYFFAELDTYKIGTVRNSTSMQHKGVSHRYTIDDFEVDEEIKELWRNGVSQKEIANMYEVKQAQVSVICRDEKSTSDKKELFEHCWYWEQILDTLNMLREKYLDTKDYKYFRLIRQLIPMGYLYTSTITMNYENLLNMYHQRKHHKLTEWSKSFCDWVKTLPYAEELICLEFH